MNHRYGERDMDGRYGPQRERYRDEEFRSGAERAARDYEHPGYRDENPWEDDRRRSWAGRDPYQGAGRGARGEGREFSDQIWSGEGRMDSGRIAQPPYETGYESGPDSRRASHARDPYSEDRYERGLFGQRRFAMDEGMYDQFGRGAFGQAQFAPQSGGHRRGAFADEGFQQGEQGPGGYSRGGGRSEYGLPWERSWDRERGGSGSQGGALARGPKGYRRSDERIQEDISERLWRAQGIDSSDVSITVKGGTVILSGSVPQRWVRHEIENIAADCMGVQDVENNIRVGKSAATEASAGAVSGSRAGSSGSAGTGAAGSPAPTGSATPSVPGSGTRN